MEDQFFVSYETEDGTVTHTFGTEQEAEDFYFLLESPVAGNA